MFDGKLPVDAISPKKDILLVKNILHALKVYSRSVRHCLKEHFQKDGVLVEHTRTYLLMFAGEKDYQPLTPISNL